MDAINGFSGDFRWLSNFWVAPVVFEGMTFPSSEAAYQAAKSLDPEVRKEFQKLTPGKAKRYGRKIEMREDWDDVRVHVMYSILTDKFTRNADLGGLLLLTGNAYLEETNHWGDTFWGVCGGEGENHLGEILMEIREDLRIKIEDRRDEDIDDGLDDLIENAGALG